jgi:DNA-binding response OmpR family regulator
MDNQDKQNQQSDQVYSQPIEQSSTNNEVQSVDASIQQKIMIAEDNPSLAEIYKVRLEAIGYLCFTAGNGEEALSLVEQQKPDLVLLDLMMPKIAGDEVLKRIRASEWGKNMKVYIISNLNEEDAPAGLRDLGIEGYSVKVNLANDDIDNIVNKILRPNAS